MGDDLDRHNGLLAQPWVQDACPSTSPPKKATGMTKLLEYSPPVGDAWLHQTLWGSTRLAAEPGACGALRFFLQFFPGSEMRCWNFMANDDL